VLLLSAAYPDHKGGVVRSLTRTCGYRLAVGPRVLVYRHLTIERREGVHKTPASGSKPEIRFYPLPLIRDLSAFSCPIALCCVHVALRDDF